MREINRVRHGPECAARIFALAVTAFVCVACSDRSASIACRDFEVLPVDSSGVTVDKLVAAKGKLTLELRVIGRHLRRNPIVPIYYAIDGSPPVSRNSPVDSPVTISTRVSEGKHFITIGIGTRYSHPSVGRCFNVHG